MPEPFVLLVVTDLLARSRLEEAAKAEGVSVVSARRFASAPAENPVLVVIDLDTPGAIEDVETWRTTHGAVPIAGFISHVDTEGWKRVEALGVQVMTRGQAASVVRRLFRQIGG